MHSVADWVFDRWLDHEFEKEDKIENQLHDAIRDSADPERFRYRPWWEGEPVSSEVYHAHIEHCLESQGYWETYGELRMGDGPTVRIERVEIDSQIAYRTTASCGISMTGDYESIDRALTMASVFATLAWNVLMTEGWKGLVLSSDQV